MATLLLRLNSPLQSWGTGSLYDDRETDYYPSKSGVIGLLAAALGRDRSDNVDDLNNLKFGVRIDNQGVILDDFQITDMGEKLNKNLSHKKYLSDATFLVGLECNDKDKLLCIRNAVLNPKFVIFLGKKSCPPTSPIVIGIREKSLYDALLDEPWLLPNWRQKEKLRFKDKEYLRIIVDSDESNALMKDVAISYSSKKREYKYRYVEEAKGKFVYNNVESTEHNPMEELEN